MVKEKVKKPFYKKLWVWVIVGLFVFFANIDTDSGGSTTPAKKDPAKTLEEVNEAEEKLDELEAELDAAIEEGTEAVTTEVEAEEEPAKPEMTVSQENAVITAERYISMGGFSKKSLAEQIEYEGFPKEDVDFAIANIDVDWKEQCKQSAERYMEMGGFSKQSLTEQLQYEGFLPDEVTYGVQQVGL